MRKLKNKKAYKIQIPHLGYTIIYGINKKEFIDRQANSVMFAENTNKNMGAIIFRKQPNDADISTVAHEVVHVLQFICRRRNINMEDETEHMGYLMQYILNEIRGYKYEL